MKSSLAVLSARKKLSHTASAGAITGGGGQGWNRVE